MKYIYLLIGIFSLYGCAKEQLSDISVVDENAVQRNHTELDTWIEKELTLPYGIEVVYRWEANATQRNRYLYPPETRNVKKVLETIKYLWIDLYESTSGGGKDFMKGKLPIKIYMYGGANIDSNGAELVGNSSPIASEMYLYNVNDFDPSDADKVFVLMRSVHHQFALRLAEINSYPRDKFLSISQNKYLSSTITLAPILRDFLRKNSHAALFKLQNRMNKRGFYTFYAQLSAQEDFAEMVSSTLLHTPTEVLTAETNAKTPNLVLDPEEQQENNEQAREAYRQIKEKQALIEEYFKKNWKINLKQLQITSIRRNKTFLTTIAPNL